MTRKSLILVAGGAIATALVGTAIGAGAAEVAPRRGGSPPPAVVTPTDDSSPRWDDRTAGPTAVPTGTATTAVSQQRAVEIALAHTGGGQVIKVETELEHGRRLWSVRIAKNGTGIRVDVDSATGQIVRTGQGSTNAGSASGAGGGVDDHGGARRGSDDRLPDDHGRHS
jgi:uncharacterized membrane protein YkoI